MAKFSYVNKEKQLVEFSFNDIKPENPINNFIQNNSVDDSYDFDELTTNGIYLFQNISKINNEVKHRPATLAGSGQLFFFSEEPSKANRIVFQLAFSDSDESKLHYRRGMANSAGLQFEEWQSTSRSTEAVSNFAISKVSPASIVGGSWIKNSSVPASMVWEHSGVSTYVDGQTSGMNVLLNLETFALSASQEVYIKESGAFQKMTLGIGCGGTGSTTAEGARNALGAASQTDLNSLRDSVSYKQAILNSEYFKDGIIKYTVSSNGVMLVCSDIRLSKTLIQNDNAILATGFPRKATEPNIIYRLVSPTNMTTESHILRIQIDSAGNLRSHYNPEMKDKVGLGNELYGTCFLLYA